MLYNQPIHIYPFQPLADADLADLKVALKGFLKKSETIKLETKVQAMEWSQKHTNGHFNIGVTLLINNNVELKVIYLPFCCQSFKITCNFNPFSLQFDPAILGGMIVSIGDKYVDMSTKTKIQKLTKLIKAA